MVGVALSITICAPGRGPVKICDKETAVGVAVRVGAMPVTAKVTVITAVLPVPAVTVTEA